MNGINVRYGLSLSKSCEMGTNFVCVIFNKFLWNVCKVCTCSLAYLIEYRLENDNICEGFVLKYIYLEK